MNNTDGTTDDSKSLEGQWQPALTAVYEELDREVASRGPVCQLSGRCCRFEEYGHTLFVSTAEVRYLLGFAPPPHGPLDEGATCPWQDSRGHCTARQARPLGCRVYYCDPTYQVDAHDLSERFVSRLKDLSTKHGIPWNYAPLHRHLHEQRQLGKFPESPVAALPSQTDETSNAKAASLHTDS